MKPRKALFETKRLSRELIDVDTKTAINRMLEAITERLRSEEHQHELDKYLLRLKHRQVS
jgi:hypothetical protein